MPSTSAKQHRFMQAVAHSPSFAKKAGVSQSVGKDFSAADKGKTFNKGGTMKKGKRFNGEDGESGVEYHDYDPDKTYSGRSFDDDTGALAENTPTRAYKPEKRETEDTPATTARARAAAPAAPAGDAAKATDAPKDAPKDYTTAKNAALATALVGSATLSFLAKKALDSNRPTRTLAKLIDKMSSKKPVTAKAHETRNPISASASTRAAPVPPVSASTPATRAAARDRRMTEATAKHNAERTPEAQRAWREANPNDRNAHLFAKGGSVKDTKGTFPGAKKGAPPPVAKPKGAGDKTMKFAHGGTVSGRADGIAQRGKTKFRIY